ncbi:MAG: LPS export ABC transporter periplasmic protein LptC [Alphaproteobacteria bacterium]|nr:LPS export ABC transporter periplasmic protein LptC [Alphaproteobacteria bacterium]
MVDVYKIDEFFNGKRPFAEKKAKKQNAKVRFLHILKLVMPSFAAVIIGFIMVFPSLKKESVVLKTDITVPKEGELEKLHIEKTVFSITNEENEISTFTADSLDEIEPGSKIVKIINPKGKLPAGKKGDMADLVAKTGFYNQNEENIKVQDDVKVVYADGSTVLTQSAEYDFNKAFGFGNDDIHAYGTWGKLWAQGFEYYQQDELLVLKGKSKVVSENKVLTADEQIKYYRLKNKVEAIGNVKVVTDTNTLFANRMVADLISSNGLNIKKIEAFGKVKIVTKDGVAKGDYAIYEPQKNQIELNGNVSIEKDENVIYGQKAITNLKTSISKIVSDTKGKNRVSGVIKGSTIKRK